LSQVAEQPSQACFQALVRELSSGQLAFDPGVHASTPKSGPLEIRTPLRLSFRAMTSTESYGWRKRWRRICRTAFSVRREGPLALADKTPCEPRNIECFQGLTATPGEFCPEALRTALAIHQGVDIPEVVAGPCTLRAAVRCGPNSTLVRVVWRNQD
jgi:hypothetical protein